LFGLPRTSILPVEAQFSDFGCRAPNKVNDLPLYRELLSGTVFDQDAAVMAWGWIRNYRVEVET
jgi:hypothetical protein